MTTCPDCGERVYSLGCTNCNEAAYIEEQEMLTDLHYPNRLSPVAGEAPNVDAVPLPPDAESTETTK